MQLLVPLTAALVALLITPGLLFHFDITPKVAILLYGTAIALLLWRWRMDDFRDRISRWFLSILAAQLAWMCISTVFSGDRSLSLDGSEWRRLGLTTWAALYLFTTVAYLWIRSASNVLRMLRWCSAAGALVAIYTILQYFGFDPLLPSAAYHAGEGPFTIVRPPGTLGHADYAAAYLVFAVFISLAQSRLEPGRRLQQLALAVTAISFVAAVLTGTRSGLVAIAAGAVVLVVVDRRHVRRYAAVGASAIVVIGAMVLSPGGEKLRARIHWSLDDPYGGARLLLWRDTVRMSSTAPILGFGPETFVLRFPQFQSIELARAYPDFFHESPHNSVLDALVAGGVPGAILFLGGWAIAFWAGWKARAQPVASPILACAIALLVALQFTVFVPALAMIALLIQAILVRLYATEAEQTAAIGSTIAPLALAPVSLVLAVAATRLVIGDHALIQAKDRIDAGDIRGAQAAFATAERWQLRGGTADLYYSRSMAVAANRSADAQQRGLAWGEALRSGATAAGRYEQRQNAWYSLASLVAVQGDSVSVERCLRNAIQWAPNWFKPHWTLAQLLELNRRHGEAVIEAASALDRNAGKNPEVVLTWKRISKKVQQ